MDEDELINRANIEREKLFMRYEHGREPGAEIDSWEDPGYEVYHQTDRYGFIHDKRLPQKADPNESKANAIEMERVKKWLKMLNRWGSKETTEKLRKRVYKGIPDKLRSRVWIKLLNLEKTMSENKDVYQKMLKLARQWSTEARQIDSDVNRQFREHLFYRERYNIKQKSLFNVLTAYSMYNMEVGYCQGMSGIAGVLLMYMDEEEAFWALSTLLSNKKYAMHGLYIEGFPKLTRFLAHHDKIIGKFLPKVKKHFDQYNLDSILYSLKWFFVVFVERIPFNLCLRVWDTYLLDGERVVTGMAYTILKLHKNKILKLKDMDLIVQYIQVKLHKDFFYDDDHVIKALEQSIDELRKSKLDLPPPPTPNEFPKRPFGIFTEPSFEAKIGRRKSIFTETEKEVTDTVVMRREITAQEIAESRLSDGIINGSTTQLNTGNVPESEDGCSLIGSSRKSLADTSVTSTADLSIFSGGQRSQQTYDICIDDNNQSIHSDNDEEGGESSPGSAFCSLSVVGRTPSALMITPRAMSPHDVVRIYVPPATPDEQKKLNDFEQINSLGRNNKHGQIPTQSSSTSTSSAVVGSKLANLKNQSSAENLSKSHTILSTSTSITSSSPPSSSQMKTNEKEQNGIDEYHQNQQQYSNKSNRNSYNSGEITPVRNSLYRSDEDIKLLTELITTTNSNGIQSTSSSRRGSMSRKSPSLVHDKEFYYQECSHIKSRKNSSVTTPTSPTTTTTVLVSGTNESGQQIKDDNLTEKINKNNTFLNNLVQYDKEPKKRMTSFEELAMKNRNNDYDCIKINTERMTRSSDNYDNITNDYDDNNYDGNYYSINKNRTNLKQEFSKYGNNCNIQYKALLSSSSVGGVGESGSVDIVNSDVITSSGNGGGGGGGGNSDSNGEYKTTFKNVKRQSGSSFEYDVITIQKQKEKLNKKNYNRHYFTSGDDDDDEYNDYDYDYDDKNQQKTLNKSSDDSSSSPNSKSVLTTPVNEMLPLLMQSPTQQQKLLHYNDEDEDVDDDDDEDITETPIKTPILISPVNRYYSESSTSSSHNYRNYDDKNFELISTAIIPSDNDKNLNNKNNDFNSSIKKPSKIPLYHQSSPSTSSKHQQSPQKSFNYEHRQQVPSQQQQQQQYRIKSPTDSNNVHKIDVKSSQQQQQKGYDNRIIASTISGPYEFTSSPSPSSGNSRNTLRNSNIINNHQQQNIETNKIRIKINHNEKNQE